MPQPTILWMECGACSGESMAILGAEVGAVHGFTEELSPPVRAAVPVAATMVAREAVH